MLLHSAWSARFLVSLVPCLEYPVKYTFSTNCILHYKVYVAGWVGNFISNTLQWTTSIHVQVYQVHIHTSMTTMYKYLLWHMSYNKVAELCLESTWPIYSQDLNISLIELWLYKPPEIWLKTWRLEPCGHRTRKSLHGLKNCPFWLSLFIKLPN